LRGIQLFALCAEDPLQERIHFFAQQFELRPCIAELRGHTRMLVADARIFRRRESEIFAQLFLAWCRLGHRASSTTAPFKCSELFAMPC